MRRTLSLPHQSHHGLLSFLYIVVSHGIEVRKGVCTIISRSTLTESTTVVEHADGIAQGIAVGAAGDVTQVCHTAEGLQQLWSQMSVMHNNHEKERKNKRWQGVQDGNGGQRGCRRRRQQHDRRQLLGL